MDDLQVGQVELFLLQLALGSGDVLRQARGQVCDGVEAEDVGDEVVEQPPGRQAGSLSELPLRGHGCWIENDRKGPGSGFRRGWYPAEVEGDDCRGVEEAGERCDSETRGSLKKSRSDDDDDEVENRERTGNAAEVVHHAGDEQQIPDELDECLGSPVSMEQLQKGDVDQAGPIGEAGEEIEEGELPALFGGGELQQKVG